MKTDLSAYKASMRRTGRERTVAAMREGRILRPIVIPSGKRYKRKPKHLG